MSAPVSFTPVVGRRLGASAVTPVDDLAPESGSLGRPVWGPGALLADLALRLGLADDAPAAALREQVFAARCHAIPSRRFWTDSFTVDPSGTAAALLALRDALVDAGWTGAPIDGGGPRLEALAELEALEDPPLPFCAADRLARVAQGLATTRARPYDALVLADPRALWSARWQAVFHALESAGTPLRALDRPTAIAPAATDLARLQARIRGEQGTPPLSPQGRGVGGEGIALAGDGSLLLVRAPTSWELGETIAALLRTEPHSSATTIVIRGGEPAALDAGLATQGLPTLGVRSASAWRPALQVLPLAIGLTFEPRDPYRLLELLTLPVGPFQGHVGRALARALTEAPGTGSTHWREAKQKLRDRVADRPADEKARVERQLARVEAWLESPGVPRDTAAPRARLLELASRIEEWLRARAALATTADDSQKVLSAAHAQARAFRRVLEEETRAHLTLVEARTLADRVTSAGIAVTLDDEQPGRLAHVDEPGALLSVRDTVVFWHAVSGTERRPALDPWREPERIALARAGVALPDVAAQLADENESWRNAVLGARRTLLFAVPDTAAGARCTPHPLWDEIVARLGADDAAVARITRTAHDLRAHHLPLAPAPGATLPPARLQWSLPAVPAPSSHRASSLDALLRCPLRWTLQYGARLRTGAVSSLPADHVLAGTLGHRLVERLHESGALALDTSALRAAATAALDALLAEEGTPWLLPGRAFDREQKRMALLRAVEELARGLQASALSVESVELPLESAWGARSLHGRADLLARGPNDQRVVVDLKWGRSSYEKLLRAGLALQLAVYARAATTSRPLPAAYFSLKKAEFLTTEPDLLAGVGALDGPSTTDTIDRAERTLTLVEQALAEGRVPAAGVSASPGLLATLGVSDADAPRHLDYRRDDDGHCKYCAHGPICGKSWEALR